MVVICSLLGFTLLGMQGGILKYSIDMYTETSPYPELSSTLLSKTMYATPASYLAATAC